jgi:hypothetical protein
MPTLLDRVDGLFARVRAQPFFLRMTVFMRILLAAGFVPTGTVKLLGQRFTLLSPQTPIGAFFEALYQTGGFWRFVGFCQIAAGLLVLVPRLAHLGAALFLPIMVNIFVVTVSLGFRGTPIVTGLMLLAVLYLCAWDWHRFRGMFTEHPLASARSPRTLRLDPLERAGFLVFAGSLIAFFAARGLARGRFGLAVLALGLAAGVFTLCRFLTTGRRLRAPD